MTEKTWTVVASDQILKDRWIDLRADVCRTPSGAEIAPYYVLSYSDWVHIVAITTDDELVLVRQYRHGVGGWVTELPGGMADPGDPSLAESAARELLEETGYRAAETPRLIASLDANPATHTNRVHTFLALGVTLERPPALEAGEEGLSVLLMPMDQVADALRRGEIGQAMHVAGLSLALLEAGYLRA
ncbi:NUDIX hydrolase [Affinirhizobium pseudoryzae]|uniref:NUDIX hydrolase n=1 Tax=Allorhizobium pseudoryzae TaxID=379684 RepID=UPI0013EB0C28|nr:NUDIX hydrolase [Allorhizobium pseudoryzae]